MRRRAGILVAGAVLVVAPTALVAQMATRDARAPESLVAATAWRDWVSGQRAPQVVPTDGDTESAIVIVDGDALGDVAPGKTAAARDRIAATHLAVEGAVQGIGGVVTHRYRSVLNGIAVRVPEGHLTGLAEISGISAVIPVQYLSPASAVPTQVTPTGDGTQGTPPAVPAGASPAHVALIDSGVDATHPWLGGGVGPNRLIIGGTDLVEGDSDPSPDTTDPSAEAHGTQMASIILRSPALAGLPPAQIPRLLAYRVTARETVDGHVRTLARSDRVLAALELAMDPNRDGQLDDHADVIVLGVARGFGGGGIDPVARALTGATRAGAVVVAPAGNDGPTATAPGSVGAPASAPGVLAVGGMAGEMGPRTADLTASVGPGSAALTQLPLMGSDPGDSARAGAALVVAAATEGVGSGVDIRDFAGADGRSTVAGGVAMVTRSGAPIGDVARHAAKAGAVALVVWDQSGTGAFPGIGAGADAPIPIVGLAAQQGAALLDLLRRSPSLTVAIGPHDAEQAPPAVASFSSRGPSATGTVVPQLVAPSVGVQAAFPGKGTPGNALQAPLSGTSASAAIVGAEAVRLRVDHPDWTPADVRSALVQSASRVPGAAITDVGAGAAPDAGSLPMRSLPGVSISPALVSGVIARDDDTQIPITLRDLTGTGGRYHLLMQQPDGTFLSVGRAFNLSAGGRHATHVVIPRGPQTGAATYQARVVVAPVGGEVAAGSALVWASTRAPAPARVLGTPTVEPGGSGVGTVTVRVGMRDVRANGLVAATLHDVSMSLVPVGGGTAIRMTGAEPSGDWPASTYRIRLSHRDAKGVNVPAGRYRVQVTAQVAGGGVIRARSRVFIVR